MGLNGNRSATTALCVEKTGGQKIKIFVRHCKFMTELSDNCTFPAAEILAVHNFKVCPYIFPKLKFLAQNFAFWGHNY